MGGLAAGLLRHPITIQKRTRTHTNGEYEISWENVATTRASIQSLTAKEFISAGVETSQVDTKITIRYRNDISANCRIKHGNMFYDVKGILADPTQAVSMTLMCTTTSRYE